MTINNNIIIYDLLNDEISEYTSVQEAAQSIYASVAVIKKYAKLNADNNKHIAKGRYVISNGSEHEKTVDVMLLLHPIQLKIINKIMNKNPKVLSKFINACAQDFILKYYSDSN